MPLIAWAVLSWVAGLLTGFAAAPWTIGVAVTAAVALAVFALLRLRADAHASGTIRIACALVLLTGVFVARDARRADERRGPPSAPYERNAAGSGVLGRWRTRVGTQLDSLFQADAGVVRALLIADTRDLTPDVRDRFATAGLVHVLSISGLHVAIIAEAMLLVLQAMRLGRRQARVGAALLTACYVAAIGAPAPAVRSAVMLAASTLSLLLQRPVSPWVTLALGAVAPLVEPRTVLDLGWQLSVAGFAALTAVGIWCRRHLPDRLRGWRRAFVRDVLVSIFATLVTAPLVAWAFGRVSLVAPLTNLCAAPVLALLQPTLFLAMLLAPWHGVATVAVEAARPLLHALDAIATSGARVPHAALSVSPSLAVAASAGIASLALVVALASRRAGRALIFLGVAIAACVWWPLAPAGSGEMELHVIDVGQGDAIGVRTPRGRWVLIDAGRTWRGGDAGRSTVVPYLRRYGGEVALFILSHPHADHVGGAATVLRALRPSAYVDAAFAGGSEPYRSSLEVARAAGVAWARVRPGTTYDLDGVEFTFLAPDSAWSSGLHDPNLASTVMRVRHGALTFLLTGDAEAAEESWVLARSPDLLSADVLKVAHHGSSTSSTPAFLDAVHPRVAVVSVGRANGYGHPSSDVVGALRARGTTVLRTDQLGAVVLRSDGRRLEAEAAGHRWTVPPRR